MTREQSEERYFPNWPKLVKLATLLLWFVAFAGVLVTGRYLNFLRRAFGVLMGGAALLVLLMIISQLRGLRVKHEHDAGCLEMGQLCSYKHRLQGRFFYPVLIFLVPLLLLAASSSQGLNTYAAIQRMMTGPGEAGAELTVDESRLPETAPDTFRELRLNELDTNFGQWVGKPVAAIGMVYRREETPEGQFLLMRFLIACCAADAQPLVIHVRAPVGQVVEKDSWARVSGIALNGVLGLRPVKVIYAYQVEQIPPPRNPYL